MLTGFLAFVNTLLKSKKHHRIISFLCILSLLSPIPFSSVDAATKFVGIDIEQKVVIAKVGDKIELNPSGYYYEKLFSDEDTQCFEDISNVKWKSSDKMIATVNSKGVLTAVAPGKCTITATWKDKKAQSKVRIYTEKELYNQVLFADIAHEDIFMALTTDYFKNYDLLYDSEHFEDVATQKVLGAKKAREIIDSVISKDMSDYEKTMAIAEWIINNIEVVHKNYKSKFTKDNLHQREKIYYYLDPLIYGKSNERGIGSLFELLLNICGIRSELVVGSFSFNTDQGEEINPIYSNVVELDGEYYYFDLMQISSDKMELEDETKRDYSFYDFIVTENRMVNLFVHITTANEDDDLTYGFSPRLTNYDYEGLYYVSLGNTPNKYSKYSYYFYDFYNEAIRFVTFKEEEKNPGIGYKPSIPVLPYFPDSTSTKYKEILNQEASFNSKVVEVATAVDTLYQAKLNNELVDYSDVSDLASNIAGIENEFISMESSFANRNLIKYIKNKIADTKTTLAKLQ